MDKRQKQDLKFACIVLYFILAVVSIFSLTFLGYSTDVGARSFQNPSINVNAHGGLTNALTYFGETSNVNLFVSDAQTISSGVTVPANIKLEFVQGAYLSIASGITLFVYSPANIVASPNQRIFSYASGGWVRFLVGGDVSPIWWDGTDVGEKINRASQSLPKNLPAAYNYSGNGRVIVPGQPYDKLVTTFNEFTEFSTTIYLEPGIEVDFNHARLEYTGVSVAVTNQYNHEKDFRAKNIWLTSAYTSGALRSGTTAVMLNGATHSNIDIDRITNFQFGVVLKGDPNFAVRTGAVVMAWYGECSWNNIVINSIWATDYPIYLVTKLADPNTITDTILGLIGTYQYGDVTQNTFTRTGSGALVKDGDSKVGISLVMDASDLGAANQGSSYLASNTFTNFDIEGWPIAIYCEGAANNFREIYTEGSTVAAQFGAFANQNTVEFNRSRPVDDQSIIDPYMSGTTITGGNRIVWKNDMEFWKTGSWSPKNLLINGDLDYFNSGVSPIGWLDAGAGQSTAEETTIKRSGSSSLKLMGTDGILDYSRQLLASTSGVSVVDNLSNKVVTFTAWAYLTTAAKSTSNARLTIYSSGSGTSTYNSNYHSGGTGWEQLTVTGLMPHALTTLNVRFTISRGVTTYFDEASLIVGDQVIASTPHIIDESDVLIFRSDWTPGALADGSGVTVNMTVTGAALGDWVQASTVIDLKGLTLTAYVQAANTIQLVLVNHSGSGVTLANEYYYIRVMKNPYN